MCRFMCVCVCVCVSVRRARTWVQLLLERVRVAAVLGGESIRGSYLKLSQGL